MWQLIRISLFLSVMTLGLGELYSLAGDIQRGQTVTLQIEGMTCGTCVKDVKTSLANVPGVGAVEFTIGKKWLGLPDYSDARASVTFDPEKTGEAVLIKAVESASTPLSAYKARVLKE